MTIHYLIASSRDGKMQESVTTLIWKVEEISVVEGTQQPYERLVMLIFHS